MVESLHFLPYNLLSVAFYIVLPDCIITAEATFHFVMDSAEGTSEMHKKANNVQRTLRFCCGIGS